MAKEKKDIVLHYENLNSGMMVTTEHTGSGEVHSQFVPGNFCIPVKDEDGKETNEMEIVSGLRYLQWKTAKKHEDYLAAKKAAKKK